MSKHLIAFLYITCATMVSLVSAATFVVDNTGDAADSIHGNGICATANDECTFRAAIQEALALSGNDLVELPPGLYAPYLGPLSFPFCDPCDAIEIVGAGPQHTVLDGTSVEELIHHSRGIVRLEDVTVRNAAIYAGSSVDALTLSRVLLSSTDFIGGGHPGAGALVIEDSSSDTPLVITPSQLTLLRVSFLDLRLDGPLRANVIDSSIDGNVNWTGGAFSLTLDGVHVRGGVFSPNAFSPKTLNIFNSVIEGSASDGVRGGAELGFTLRLSNTVVTGAAGCGVHLTDRSHSVTILDSDLVENRCGVRLDWAALASETLIQRSRILDNDEFGMSSAGSQSTSDIQVVDSTVGRNGGIGLDMESWNSLTLLRSTVHDNAGGGVQLVKTWPLPNDQSVPRLAVINSTVSGNVSGGSGAGIRTDEGGVILRNATITGNVSDVDGNGVGDGGGIEVIAGESGFGTVTLQNSIVAGNTDAGSEAPDCVGTLESEGYNLIQSTAGCNVAGSPAGDILGQSALLLPLADNGGFSFTHALETSSPAYDGGDPSGCRDPDGATLVVDQRGLPRHERTACDIGACELVLSLTLDRVATGTELTLFPGLPLDAFEVIRGDLANLTAGVQVDLGPVNCVAAGTSSPVEDALDPAPGAGFFYLGRYRIADQPLDYGLSSAGLQREPSSGECE